MIQSHRGGVLDEVGMSRNDMIIMIAYCPGRNLKEANRSEGVLLWESTHSRFAAIIANQGQSSTVDRSLRL